MTKRVFVLVEHRRGEIRDITYELLTKGRELASKLGGSTSGGELVALLLGYNVEKFADKIKSQSHKVFVIEDEKLKNFNAESYQIVLSNILKKEKPSLTLIGHTAFGIDLAPAIGTELNIPVATDCIGIDVEDNNLITIRQMYGGKLNARLCFSKSEQFVITVRQGAFVPQEANLNGELVTIQSPLTQEPDYRKFVEYLEAVVGEIDITKADIVVAVGRGIKEQGNLHLVDELAKSLGGVLACSRPIVDAGWLPKDRQVGSSGKTVKPKLYIAVGISGAFQHITGMKGADTIVAINKDPNAPIFNEADYGIVGDLFKVVPAIKEKIAELKPS
ncbi:MAG: electron transfer flavoprotein subunit alpha/FixB family protein [bacterium]|nr:electron transfer flavoprotein subunit alpha/FixB family protein [bacterium]